MTQVNKKTKLFFEKKHKHKKNHSTSHQPFPSPITSATLFRTTPPSRAIPLPTLMTTSPPQEIHLPEWSTHIEVQFRGKEEKEIDQIESIQTIIRQVRHQKCNGENWN